MNPISSIYLVATCVLAVIALSPFIAKWLFPTQGNGGVDALPIRAIQLGAGLAVTFVAKPVVVVVAATCIAGILLGGRVVALSRGKHADCNCFGTMPIPFAGFYGFLALAGVASAGTICYIQIAVRHLPPLWMIVTGVGAALALVFVLLSYQKYKTNFYSLGMVTGPAAQSVGHTEVVGTTRDGESLDLSSVLSDSHAVFIVFVSATCPACHDLATALSILHAQGSGRMPLVFVSDAHGAFAISESSSGIRTLIDPKMDLARRVHAAAMPAAIAVSSTGEIVAPVAHGPAQVRNLYTAATEILESEYE